jgi:hypothetical protein
VPIIYWTIAFEATPEKFFYYFIVFFETIAFYSIFGQFLVYCTGAQAIAQVGHPGAVRVWHGKATHTRRRAAWNCVVLINIPALPRVQQNLCMYLTLPTMHMRGAGLVVGLAVLRCRCWAAASTSCSTFSTASSSPTLTSPR